MSPDPVKSRPILFSAPMVQAILAGTKTQTRRIAKLTDSARVKAIGSSLNWHPADDNAIQACPYGQPGDQLWVKETFCDISGWMARRYGNSFPWIYRADPDAWIGNHFKWKPSIFMPRAASRITLQITSIRLQRLQDISEEDANAEGCPLPAKDQDWSQCRAWYRALWNSINGPTSWQKNPYVWAITFTRS